MDFVLESATQHEFPVVGTEQSNTPLQVSSAELLQATSLSELEAEIHSLRRRGVSMVSVRRQKAMRVGPDLLRKVIHDSGIRVCAVAFAGGFTGTLSRGYRQAVDDTRRALEYAAKLRARSVVVVPGSRGLHTYNHAERTVRDGLFDCLDDALRYRIDMVVPVTPVFGTGQDIFLPRGKEMLKWIADFDTHRIKSLMMLRGKKPWPRLPDCWRKCLIRGGILRVSKRCRATLGEDGVSSYIKKNLRSRVYVEDVESLD